jgi:hypothetical protein
MLPISHAKAASAQSLALRSSCPARASQRIPARGRIARSRRRRTRRPPGPGIPSRWRPVRPGSATRSAVRGSWIRGRALSGGCPVDGVAWIVLRSIAYRDRRSRCHGSPSVAASSSRAAAEVPTDPSLVNGTKAARSSSGCHARACLSENGVHGCSGWPETPRGGGPPRQGPEGATHDSR